jgi:hypothetical protein
MTNSPFGDNAYQPQMVDPRVEDLQYAPTPGSSAANSQHFTAQTLPPIVPHQPQPD